MGGGFVHILRIGGVSGDRRVRQKSICRRGIGFERSTLASGASPGEARGDFAAASARDFGPQNASLQTEGPSLVFVEGDRDRRQNATGPRRLLRLVCRETIGCIALAKAGRR